MFYIYQILIFKQKTMKTTISIVGSTLLFLTFVLSLGCGNGEKYTDPVKYNDAIVDQLNEIDQYFVAIDSIAGEDEFNYDLYEKTRKEAIKKIAECEASIKDLGPFKKDDALQKAALDYLKDAKYLFENNWKTIGEKMNKLENLSDKESEKFLDMIEEAYDKYEQILHNFSDVQQNFADIHGYEIE